MGDQAAGILQLGVLVVLLAAAHVPVGNLLHNAATGTRHTRVERGIYKLVGVDPDKEQSWRHYLFGVLGFSLASVLVLFSILRLQHLLPLSLGFASVPAEGAFNTAISFVTNTNWQWYSGENTLGFLAQALGLAVQNFVSGAV